MRLSFSAGLAALALWAALVLLSLPSLGAPPENADPALAPWFQSLQSPNGKSCCSIADCRPVSYRVTGDHYEVLAGADDRGHEVWLAVAPDVVLERYDNPTGRPVACILGGRVLCFVRAAES